MPDSSISEPLFHLAVSFAMMLLTFSPTEHLIKWPICLKFRKIPDKKNLFETFFLGEKIRTVAVFSTLSGGDGYFWEVMKRGGEGVGVEGRGKGRR